MRRYLISLLTLTLVLVLASFIVMWTMPDKFILAMPLLALYFGVVAAVQHFLVTRGMSKSPKTFVQIFLGSTVGVLFLHLIVLAFYLFSSPTKHEAMLFLVAFLIGFVVSLVFETAALVKFVNNEKKRRAQDQNPA